MQLTTDTKFRHRKRKIDRNHPPPPFRSNDTNSSHNLNQGHITARCLAALTLILNLHRNYVTVAFNSRLELLVLWTKAFGN